MEQFVYVVVDYLSQVKESALMELKSSRATDLDSGGVYHTQISDEITAVKVKDHEL